MFESVTDTPLSDVPKVFQRIQVGQALTVRVVCIYRRPPFSVELSVKVVCREMSLGNGPSSLILTHGRMLTMKRWEKKSTKKQQTDPKGRVVVLHVERIVCVNAPFHIRCLRM